MGKANGLCPGNVCKRMRIPENGAWGVYCQWAPQMLLPSPPESSVSAPAMLQPQQYTSPAPLSPTTCPHWGQPQLPAPGWDGGTGPGGQTLPWQIPWAAPTSCGPGKCPTTFLETFWGCWLVLCSLKVNASLGFLWDPGPGQSSGMQADTSTLCHSRVLGWNLLNFTYRHWLWKTLCWNQISKCNVGTWRTLFLLFLWQSLAIKIE